jgi:glucose/arabinose dehydrogenase
MMLRRSLPLTIVAVILLTGCTAPPRSGTTSSPPASAPAGALRPAGNPTVLATGLAAPWSIVRLGTTDSTLISERDSGTVVEREPSGQLRNVGVVPGVVHAGEGGLLGLAVDPSDSDRWLYAYLTTATDNRIVRMPLLGTSGSYRLGAVSPILTGLAKAANHDGGRIAFGPDGMLYATVGDAGQPSRAQDPASLNGKILRMTPTGAALRDNPISGSLVYSLGHRNPQGIAWDADGQLWAAEFGQSTWDEFNRIEPGGNYGWPEIEGIGSKKGFIDPVYQWPTAEASPSGLAFVGGNFFLTALRGERLWAISPGSNATTALPFLTGSLGRLRDTVPGPDGSLWLLTNNTDGRGSATKGDDKLVEVRLDVARTG